MNFKATARKALLQSKNQEIAKLAEKLQAIEQKYDKDLQSMIKSKNTEIDNLKSDLLNKSQECSNLESIIKSKDDEINVLKTELNRQSIEEEAATKIQSTWKGHKVRQKGVEQVIKENSETQDKKNELKQAFIENEELRKKIDSLKQIASKHKNNQQTQKQQKDLIQKLKNEVDTLQKKCDKSPNHEELIKTCNDLKANNKHLMGERKRIMTEYKQSMDERKRITTEYQNKTLQLQQYQKQVPLLRRDIVTWKNRAMYLQQQLGPMEENYMQQLKQLDQLLKKHAYTHLPTVKISNPRKSVQRNSIQRRSKAISKNKGKWNRRQTIQ